MPQRRTPLLLGLSASIVLGALLAWWSLRTAPAPARDAAPDANDAPRRGALTRAQQELYDAMAGTPPGQRQGFFILPAALADLSRVSLRAVVDRLRQQAQAGDAAALRRLADIESACDNVLYGEQRRQEFRRTDPPSPAVGPCRELSADEIAAYADDLYAAARAGDADARLRLHGSIDRVRGDAAHKQQARDDALRFLRERARAGDPQAMIELAQDAMLGQLRPRDYVYAYACYLQAMPRLHGENERKGAEYTMHLLRERLSASDLARAQARAASPAPFD